MGNFDPLDKLSELDIMGSSKTPLQGERRAVFPQGVPGVPQGVPPDMVKGYQPPAEAPPPVVEAKPARPKPKKTASAPAAPRRPQPQQQQQQQQQQQEVEQAPRAHNHAARQPERGRNADHAGRPTHVADQCAAGAGALDRSAALTLHLATL